MTTMPQVTTRLSLATLILSALLTLILAVPAEMAQAAATPAVFQPTARPYGKTHGDWAALWAQWFFRVPLHKDANDHSKGILHPNFETTGATCAAGQAGAVFFLANLHPDTANAVRRCTVPAGKALLLPVASGICSNLPGERKSVADLQDECRRSLDVVTEASVEIDGVAVPNVLSYRAQSRPFSYRIPKDDCCFLGELGAKPGTYWPAISEGYFVMIQPLPKGQHTIRYREHSPLVGPPIEATYILTIA
jgi:hypothetical protein